MKQEIRFLDCIERDLKSWKKTAIKMGISSAICFLVGIMTVLVSAKNITVEPNKLMPILVIGMLTAIAPMIFTIPLILAYMGRRQNRNNWIEITKKVPFNEEITVYNSKLKRHIGEKFESFLMNDLLVELLPNGDMKVIITQGEESDTEVKIIYKLSNGLTVTEKFICFQNDNVIDLMRILSVR